MSSLCLFCRKALVGWIAPEHIVPDSIGGWITIRSVCNPCNHRFGGQVDSFAMDGLFVTLRRETALPVPDTSSVWFYDEDVGEVVPGRRLPDGRVESKRTIFDREGEFIVRGRTPDLADAEFERYAARQSKRGYNLTVLGRRTTEENEAVARTTHAPTAEIVPRLLREGAKAAIEYVAYVCGDKIALDPVFDHVRAYASNGQPDAGVTMEFMGKGSLYLPRTQTLLTESNGSDPPQVTDAEAHEIRGGAPGVRRLTQIVHRLVLIRQGGMAQFHLWLFGWVRVVVPLSDHPAIPTQRLDYRDFTHGRKGTLYGW